MHVLTVLTPAAGPATAVFRYSTDATVRDIVRSVANLLIIAKQTIPPLNMVELMMHNLPGDDRSVVIVVQDYDDDNSAFQPDYTVFIDYDNSVVLRGPNKTYGWSRSEFVDGSIFGEIDHVTENFREREYAA